MTTRETIWWIGVEIERPPVAMKVLLFWRADRRVDVGAFGGERWIVGGEEITAPSHWAAFPTGALP